MGVDARWEHCIVVFDAHGNIIEEWTQWDTMLQRPHSVDISPYDPQKHVWIVDDHKHAMYKFTNDGKKMVKTIGTYGEPGADDKHFNRPTFMAWFPDGSFFVADGYNGTRVVEVRQGRQVPDGVGREGRGRRKETRPGYFNNVHGIAVDPKTRRVFVNDRGNRRARCSTRTASSSTSGRSARPRGHPSVPHLQRRILWASAAYRHEGKMLKYDLDGNLMYSWGTCGRLPRRLLGRARLQLRSGRATSTPRRWTTAARKSSAAQRREPRVCRQAACGLEIGWLACTDRCSLLMYRFVVDSW